MTNIQQVAIVGGTHGNEFTGIHLIKHWQEYPQEIQRSNFSSELFLANPKAHEAAKRYIDQDLNRQFSLADLNNPGLDGYEHNRAKAIDQLLGPKVNPRVDFVFDLHTTTANMDTTLVLNSDNRMIIDMAFYIKKMVPEATLFFEPEPRLENNFLVSIGRYDGLLIEVGPTPQGLLRADIVEKSKTALLHGLDFLEKYNAQETLALEDSYPAFQFIEKVSLPLTESGDIAAMLHPDRQDRDYEVIHPGDPLFITFDERTIAYEGKEPIYAAFINEAAYYDRKIAFSALKPITLHRKA